MIRALRSEWIKLRTVTMNWVLTIIAIGFPVTVTSITAYVQGDQPEYNARSLVELLNGLSYVTVLLVGVVAAVSITSEYGFGTIRPTFAATPRRGRVIMAKGIVVFLYAIVLQTVVLGVGLLLGGALARNQGATLDFGSDTDLRPALIGAVVLASSAALLAFGLGMLVRSTPVSVTMFILWPLLLESLIGGLLIAITHSSRVIYWLPFRAGFQLSSMGGAFQEGPSRLVAGLYFGGVALALVLLGTLSVQRRDA
jgi:ABC-2 type transport system permease protein